VNALIRWFIPLASIPAYHMGIHLIPVTFLEQALSGLIRCFVYLLMKVKESFVFWGILGSLHPIFLSYFLLSVTLTYREPIQGNEKVFQSVQFFIIFFPREQVPKLKTERRQNRRKPTVPKTKLICLELSSPRAGVKPAT
jgi:hypothetical protein